MDTLRPADPLREQEPRRRRERPGEGRRFAAEQQRLYAVHGKANILDDPYYNPNLTMDREDFSESDDLRELKEGA